MVHKVWWHSASQYISWFFKKKIYKQILENGHNLHLNKEFFPDLELNKFYKTICSTLTLKDIYAQLCYKGSPEIKNIFTNLKEIVSTNNKKIETKII